MAVSKRGLKRFMWWFILSPFFVIFGTLATLNAGNDEFFRLSLDGLDDIQTPSDIQGHFLMAKGLLKADPIEGVLQNYAITSSGIGYLPVLGGDPGGFYAEKCTEQSPNHRNYIVLEAVSASPMYRGPGIERERSVATSRTALLFPPKYSRSATFQIGSVDCCVLTNDNDVNLADVQAAMVSSAPK